MRIIVPVTTASLTHEHERKYRQSQSFVETSSSCKLNRNYQSNKLLVLHKNQRNLEGQFGNFQSYLRNNNKE